MVNYALFVQYHIVSRETVGFGGRCMICHLCLLYYMGILNSRIFERDLIFVHVTAGNNRTVFKFLPSCVLRDTCNF